MTHPGNSVQSHIHVLTESAAATAAARKHYGDHDLSFYTHSPFVFELLRQENQKVFWLQDMLPPGAPEQLGYAATRAVDALQSDLLAVGRELSLPKAVEGVSITLQRTIAALLYKKALLDVWRANTKGRHVVAGSVTLTAVTGPDISLDRFDTIFAAFAASEAVTGIEVFEIPSVSNRSELYAEVDQWHWLDRLISFADLSYGQLIFRFSKTFLGNRSLGRGDRGPRVTVLYPNEAIREMLPELLRAGARISFHSPRRPKLRSGKAPSALPNHQRLLSVLKEATNELTYLDVTPVAGLLVERVETAARFWSSSIDEMDKEAQEIVSKYSPELVLSNWIGGFSGACLVACLKRCDVRFVLTEHGVSAGLSKMHESVRAYAEPRGADAYLVSNVHTARFLDQASELQSTILATVGLPQQMRTVPIGRLQRSLVRRRFGVRSNQRLVLFVTSPFQNTMRMIPHTPEDTEIHRTTQTVAHNVLPYVQGVPVIKLYATRRHLDPDPLSGSFPPPPPVQVCKAGDFRFMRAAADVIILDFPLSTLGWALGAGKPMFFLYQPRWGLLPDVEAALDDALFLIRTDAADWAEQLKNMLNWDDAALTRAWNAKELSRRKLLDRYIFGPENPGKNGAEFVCGFARDRSPVTKRAA